MSKAYKQFYHGKNLPKTNKGQKPQRWEPNTNIDTYNVQTGKFRSRRKIGRDGYATKDMDVSDDKHKIDHIHDYNDKERSKARLPNKKEQKELDKAKKKRRLM